MSNTVRETLDHIRVEALWTVMRLWQGWILPGQLLPAKSRLDPIALGRTGLMPSLWLVEVPEVGDPVYRLAGGSVTDAIGRGVRGRPVSKVLGVEEADDATSRWRLQLSRHLLGHARGEGVAETGETVYGERVTLPLADDTGRPAFILGCTVYEMPYYFNGPMRVTCGGVTDSSLSPVGLIQKALDKASQTIAPRSSDRRHSALTANQHG
ncbi:MAG: PAS domain-containing protein [Thalassobaculaceae bacterium]|nr:PAS domain-containing protein [Thalassobaculaceae bacterium]